MIFGFALFFLLQNVVLSLFCALTLSLSLSVRFCTPRLQTDVLDGCGGATGWPRDATRGLAWTGAPCPHSVHVSSGPVWFEFAKIAGPATPRRCQTMVREFEFAKLM
uniref:Putative secreted protein n=1 Tax=Anopheles darlingi TaxID=43151 RepID=A0A2M4DQ11_ANODA